MTQSDRPVNRVLQKVEDAFIGISDFVINFLRTTAIILQRPKELGGYIERDELTPPHTYLFICISFLSLLSTNYITDIFNFPSLITDRFRQIEIIDLIYSILPTVVFVLLMGRFIAKYLVNKDSKNLDTAKFVFYYSISFGFMSSAVIAFLFEIFDNFYFRLPYQIREDTYLIPQLFFILILFYFGVFSPCRSIVKGINNLRSHDKNKNVWMFIWLISLSVATLIAGSELLSHPILSPSKRIYIISTQTPPFKSIQIGEDSFVEIDFILHHDKDNSIVISDRLEVLMEYDETKNINYICDFEVQMPPTVGNGLIVVKPKEPTIIQAIARQDKDFCTKLLEKQDLWVSFDGWENGKRFFSGWIKSK